MRRPVDALKIVLARDIDGQTELVEGIRHADTVWIVTESEEIVIGPDAWKQAWTDLVARGFVEVSPNDQRKMAADTDRVLALVRRAFHGVTLGNGVGLHQGRGLDDYADDRTLASYRAQDEKNDWSAIPIADLMGRRQREQELYTDDFLCSTSQVSLGRLWMRARSRPGKEDR